MNFYYKKPFTKIRTALHSFLQKGKVGAAFELLIMFFAAVGVVFFSVFVGMRFGVFNVRGSIDERNQFFTVALPVKTGTATNTATTTNASRTDRADAETVSKIQNGLRACMASVRTKVFPDTSFAWIATPEWYTLNAALTKDKATIRNAARDAGISPRTLVSVVIAEQLRFFTSDRESFKKFFEPLKILGSLSQFSLGISGVKPDTAKRIEDNLKDPSSSFYPGKQYENILGNADGSPVTDDERYTRLTDSHNHYYSYLYTALFVREIEVQWSKAGYDISARPEILATLFNLGFGKSAPKADPQIAGAVITLGGEDYTFGRLAYEFYYSGELAEVFGF